MCPHFCYFATWAPFLQALTILLEVRGRQHFFLEMLLCFLYLHNRQPFNRWSSTPPHYCMAMLEKRAATSYVQVLMAQELCQEKKSWTFPEISLPWWHFLSLHHTQYRKKRCFDQSASLCQGQAPMWPLHAPPAWDPLLGRCGSSYGGLSLGSLAGPSGAPAPLACPCTNKTPQPPPFGASPRFQAFKGDATSTLSEISPARLERYSTARTVTATRSTSTKGAAILAAGHRPNANSSSQACLQSWVPTVKGRERKLRVPQSSAVR